MEPIVSPWVIYWLNAFENLGVALGIAAIISGVIAVLTGVVGHIENDKALLRIHKKLLWVFIPAFTLCVFMPSKNTMLMMIGTKHITPNNITKAIQAGSDWKEVLKTDVIEIIQAVQKPEEKGNE